MPHSSFDSHRIISQPVNRLLVAFLISSSAGFATDPELYELQPVTVIGHAHDQAFRTTIHPRYPAQPLPAQDGADILRTIPGFSMIRKGGTDGDPVLRGMAGSRIGILLDGEMILGGCGNRMDPPTAYVIPSDFDAVTVIKGPQSVMYGPGSTAGVVLFEQNRSRFAQSRWNSAAILTLGSFGRNDQHLISRAGNPTGYLDFAVNRTSADDYSDGNGGEVHSQYERWNSRVGVGWTPLPNLLAELSAILSDGEAAYADRVMDGTKFARSNVGLRIKQDQRNGFLESFEFHAFTNYVDHVMDNFSLRKFAPTPMMPGRAVSNPDRHTWGGRFTVDMRTSPDSLIHVGADFYRNDHSIRKTSDETVAPYRSMPRTKDARFTSNGFFVEHEWQWSDASRLISGFRLDVWQAEDHREKVSAGMMQVPNPTARFSRDETLPSGFVRIESNVGAQSKLHIGIGHSQRFPDYWELFNKESAASPSAFETRVEKTTQLDAGWIHQGDRHSLAVSLFAGTIDDFILIQNAYSKPMPNGSALRSTTITRSVDASTYGAEATLRWTFSRKWKGEASLAWVRGENTTDDLPLAQLPPLESTLALTYNHTTWSTGLVGRFVHEQSRFAKNQGNIVGQDLGSTPGFETFSFHFSWKPAPWTQISLGIDNLLDKAYAEHLSRGGASIAGFPPPSLKINEPGRSGWIKCEFLF